MNSNKPFNIKPLWLKALRLAVHRAMLSFALFSAAFATCKPIVVGQTFMAGSDDPTDGSTSWSLTSHGISEKLFTVDRDGDIVPQVAKEVNKVSEDPDVWEVTLKSGYKFSDGTAVDAEHVAKCLTELNTVNDAAKSTLGAMTVTAEGGKVRIESERSTHVMDAVLAEWVFAIYYKNSDGDYVFTGPYAVENWVDGDHIGLVPNKHYPRANERPRVTVCP